MYSLRFNGRFGNGGKILSLHLLSRSQSFLIIASPIRFLFVMIFFLYPDIKRLTISMVYQSYHQSIATDHVLTRNSKIKFNATTDNYHWPRKIMMVRAANSIWFISTSTMRFFRALKVERAKKPPDELNKKKMEIPIYGRWRDIL